MAAYCDFNEINGGKLNKLYHITYKEMSTNSYFHSYKYENHVYWQTNVIFTLL